MRLLKIKGLNMWTIDKQFGFCYGHRVWTQQLIKEYCEQGDVSCKCKHLHGHEAAVHVFLESSTLTRGMVTDFKHLGWLKEFIDTYLDHKFIMDVNDPLFQTVVKPSLLLNKDIICSDELPLKEVRLPVSLYTFGYIVDQSKLRSDIAPEMLEYLLGFFFVTFVPTSEHLSEFLYLLVCEKMKAFSEITVRKVEWFETPKSRSSYISE